MIKFRKEHLTEILAGLLILLFSYTAFTKLIESAKFRTALSKSPLIHDWANLLVWLIPAIELFISFLLFVPRFRTTGFIAAFILMVLFTIYIGYMLVSSSKLPCSCGGVIDKLNWKEHFAFNIGFTLLAFIGWRLQRTNDSNNKKQEMRITSPI